LVDQIAAGIGQSIQAGDTMAYMTEEIWVDGYVRVSRVRKRRGERFISPVVQREQIQQWAVARGAHLLSIFEEIDRPASGDRRLLDRAVARVESGVSQGIVVSKVDRFGRSLVSGLAAIQRISAAGGTFFAIQDGLDTSTDTGRLVLRIMLSLGEWELDRIRASWAQTHAKAVARGAYIAPATPVGYRRTRAGRLCPDPRIADVVTAAFARRAHGQSVSAVARWLEEREVRTSAGNPGWSWSTTACMLSNRVYLGEVSWGPHVNEHAHAALVDPATWQAAQHPRVSRVASDAPPALLAGLVRCESCGMAMSPIWRRRADGGRERMYACRGHSAAGTCPAPAAISGDYLEPYVEATVFDVLARRRRAPRIASEEAERKLADAQHALTRYRDSDRVLAQLGEPAFAAGLAVRAARVRAASLDLADSHDRLAVHALPSVAELDRRWSSMSLRERRDVVARAIDYVSVAPGRLQIERRVTVCGAGRARRRGSTVGSQKARRRPESGPCARPGRQWSWSQRRIERELKTFLGGLEVWPRAATFISAGRGRLYEQIVQQAGVACWAHHAGLTVPFAVRSREPWTEERVRAGLRLYLAGKQQWPSCAEFSADGLGRLRDAVARTGGMQRWVVEFPLACTASQRGGMSKATPLR
jgi:DNA invertase Pin-like site-specific DNA recombinase